MTSLPKAIKPFHALYHISNCLAHRMLPHPDSEKRTIGRTNAAPEPRWTRPVSATYDVAFEEYAPVLLPKSKIGSRTRQLWVQR